MHDDDLFPFMLVAVWFLVTITTNPTGILWTLHIAVGSCFVSWCFTYFSYRKYLTKQRQSV